jgi:hypothetical protein
LADVGELPPHHRGENAAAAVGRQDGDPGYPGRRQGSAARDRELEAVDARGADDRSVLERGQAALELEILPATLDVLVAGVAAERGRSGARECREFFRLDGAKV